MREPWEADVHLGRSGAARLIDRQFPMLAPAQLEPLGTGWDNAAYVVNGEYVFRFPRRKIAVPWIENEVRFLPYLAPRLPVPIPRPLFAGVPAGDYPYPFAGYRHIHGATACSVELSDAARAALAGPLAAFLARLHAIEPDIAAPAKPPGDDIDRTNLRRYADMVLGRIKRLEKRGVEMDWPLVRSFVHGLKDSPGYPGEPCWVHGDLYARHLLVDDEHGLCGVIDWGDLHVGDPTLDLSIAFSFLPEEGRTAFQEAYTARHGAVDGHAWERARFRALHYGVILLLYGLEVSDGALERTGRIAIEFASR